MGVVWGPGGFVSEEAVSGVLDAWYGGEVGFFCFAGTFAGGFCGGTVLGTGFPAGFAAGFAGGFAGGFAEGFATFGAFSFARFITPDLEPFLGDGVG